MNSKLKTQNLKFAFIVGALLWGFCIPAHAQQPTKVPRIGYLSAQSPSAESSRLDGLRQALRELGYVAGKNFIFENRFVEGKLERLPDLAAELVRLKVDVIVTTGSPSTRAAQQATQTIPVVMTVVGDPIEAGFVASLAKPGGNITGLTQISPQLSGKRLELLKESFPKISRVALFVDGALTVQRQASQVLQETQAAADALGVKLVSLKIQGPGADLEEAFKALTSQRAGALIIPPGPSLILHRKRFVYLTAKSRLPAMYGDSEWPDSGGLMSYGPDYIDIYHRAGVYVDKILKGAKPADLPVEQPTKFELVINLKTARQIGLTIPQSVLYRADRVIK
jgi:putative ABC transport system substrate-binding protein